MPTDLEKLVTSMPRARTSGISPQTNRALIELGEHPTFTKLPVEAAAPAPTPAPVAPGKSSLEVLGEFKGKTVEQLKAEQAAKNKAMLEAHQRRYAPK